MAAPAERGRANEAVLELLATALRVPRARLSLVAGAAARDKVIDVEGMASTEAKRLLAAHAGRGNR